MSGRNERHASLPCKPAGRVNAGFAAYLWLVILLPLVVTPFLIWLGKTDFFLHHGASVWVQANDAVFDQHDRNCKVLIFGDSTAMTGIDPALVQQQTGLPTCNISVTNAVLSVTGRLSLDHYLAHNTHPDVLVVQLSPEGFQKSSSSWQTTIYPEGILELVRHSPRSVPGHFFLHHPQQAFTFAGYVAGFSAWYGIREALYRITGITLESDRVKVHNGFFTPPMSARTSCEVPESDLPSQQIPDLRVAENYRMAVHDRTVLVDVAPIPACDRDFVRYRQELIGITDNQLEALPIQYFNDQRHFTSDGSRLLSRMISDQVAATTAQVQPHTDVTLSSLHVLRTPVRNVRERSTPFVQ